MSRFKLNMQKLSISYVNEEARINPLRVKHDENQADDVIRWKNNFNSFKKKTF